MKKTRFIAQVAIIAAMYAALTYSQTMIWPASTTMAVQFRVSEALNILALFTPAAIPGLTLGCIISNIASIGQGLPLDMIFGSLATLGSALCMYALKNVKIRTYPLFAMLMPAIFNGIVIGWEIECFFIEGDFHWLSFLTQGGFVALGELGVMLSLGTLLYYVVIKRELDKKILK